MSNGPEKTFQNKVIRELKAMGCYVLNVPGGSIKRGIPDLLFCAGGHWCALELKVRGNYPDDLQRYHIREMLKAGAYAKVVYPDEWDSVKSEIEDMVKR